MFKNGKDQCSCPNKDCKRNANCDECWAYHNGNTYCVKEQKKNAEQVD